MRVLAVVGRGYYGDASVPEPMYLYFTETPAMLGHHVTHFDHVVAARDLGVAGATDALLATIERDRPDLVLYQHAPPAPEEPIDLAALSTIADRVCTVAWNSDDDWQSDRTLPNAPHFTWMVTTYPSVHRRAAATVPNLVLSQWACLGTYAAPAPVRDLDFSFAGQLYPARLRACRVLRRRAGLQVFGRGAGLVTKPVPAVRGLTRIGWLAGPAIDFAAINDVWNRTKVSYTPLRGGPGGHVLSIKSRVFDMGLSGTVMLAERAPDLERYYDLDTELVTFETLDDAVEQAQRLLRDDARRERIAAAYAARTRAEHLWTQRFTALVRDVGL